MSLTTHQRMDALAFRGLPEGPPFFELIGGVLHMSPSPSFWHQEIVGNLYAAIRNHLRLHRQGKVVLSPSDVELSLEDVYQPDLYFVSNERFAVLREHGIKGAPDLVVEVLSPGTAKLDLGVKRAAYAKAGVLEMWAVDPDRHRIDVFRLQESSGEPVHSFEGTDVLTSIVLPGLQIPMAEAFES